MSTGMTAQDGDARERAFVAAPGDRLAAFRRARWHTLWVRLLRVALPIAAVLMLSTYGLSVRHSFGIGSGTLTTGPILLSTEKLTMEAPRYQGFNKDGSTYVMSAKSATQDLKRAGPIHLVEVDGVLMRQLQGHTRLKSPRGTFDEKANILVLHERVDIDGDDGLKVRMTEATLYLKENKVVSSKPVTVEMPTGRVRGNEMVLLQNTREVTFSNGAAARIEPEPRTPRSAPAPQGRSLGTSDAPVDVTSRSLYINDDTKVAIFRENVRAIQGEATLTSRELEAYYEGQPATAGGAPLAPASGKLRRLIAKSDVVLTQGNDRVTSPHADFDAVNEIAVLTGGVVMTSPPDRQAVSDRADLNARADTALLTGNVVVTQGRNLLKGQRLYVDRKAGTTQLTSPAEGSRPQGRIFTRLYQSDASAVPAAKAPPAKAQTATHGDAGGFTFRTDPSAPIDIEADTLNSSDAQRTAIYRGQVKAVQGEFTIQSDQMTAHYTGSAVMAAPGPAPADAAHKPTAQLQKVQARGSVVVTSTNDQTAHGDWADFDVKTNIAVLGGNVVVKQGKTVIRGPRLVINMTTGVSHLENPAPTAWSASTLPATNNGLPDLPVKGSLPQPAPPVKHPEAPGGGGCPPGRMCAVIVNEPGKAGVMIGPGAAAAPPPKPAAARGAVGGAAAAGGWDSTTTATPGRNSN